MKPPHPKLIITASAREALLKHLSALGNDEHLVGISWCRSMRDNIWRWDVGFQEKKNVPAEYRYFIDGIEFYFDGPYYQDERTPEGRVIDHENGLYKVT